MNILLPPPIFFNGLYNFTVRVFSFSKLLFIVYCSLLSSCRFHFFFFFLFFVVGDSACFNQGFFSVGILSLEIFTNLSASILLTYSSHSLLYLDTHSLIGWIPQDYLICWLLILFFLVLSSHLLPTFVWFFLCFCSCL